MKVVPEDVSTAPLEGLARPLQSTTACNYRNYKVSSIHLTRIFCEHQIYMRTLRGLINSQQ